MKKILNILFLYSFIVYGQDASVKKEDISGVDESTGVGSFGKVVNESSGKVNLSFPIAKISARSVDYAVSFNYDGINVFKQASYTARHMATGVLGVGWNIGVPKIIADTKMTASRDDDSFYLNGVELVCTNRAYTFPGYRIWEFKTNKSHQYIVKYYEILSQPATLPLDYWEVTDDKGFVYTYGYTDNTRESVLAWGNWIGDGKGDGALKHTSVWNLQMIKDQYGNNLTFSYLKVEQGYSSTSPKHTEASYLQQINSSTGEKIVFEYANKNPFEYYEPHTEAVEPDAYQERYEKSYLNKIKTYNSSNELVSNFELGYNLLNASVTEKAKRYLISITEKNSNGNYLPPNQFEYFTSGDFNGGIKKWIKPEGGFISYSYEKKSLFINNNTYVTNGYNLGGWARYCADDYYLTLGSSASAGSNSGTAEGNFYLVRDSWDGRKWIRAKFDIPEPIRYSWVASSWESLDNARFIFGSDFYAVLTFNRDTDRGSIYLFHRMKDGSWNQSQYEGLWTFGADNNNYADDPVLISGDGFVAVGVKKSGDLYTFRWNGSSWSPKQIQQGAGNYYYAANNNFVLSLNTNSGLDMPVTLGSQNTVSFEDRCYIHFLNAEKIWKTRSWSQEINAVAADISQDSYFYPSNSMSSFVAGSNPEFFLRWDTDYTLSTSKIDNVLGNYNDIFPFFPIGNNVFSGQHVGSPSDGHCYSFKQAAFTGAGWVTQAQNIWSDNGFGENRIAGYNNGGKVYTFNPNISQWNYITLPADPNESNYGSFAFGKELFIAEDRVYRINNWGFEEVHTLDPNYFRQEYAQSGGEYVYIQNTAIYDPKDLDNDGDTKDVVGNTYYYYIDKKTNNVVPVLLNSSFFNLFLNGSNRRAQQFGGKYPLFSSTNLKGSKLIDNVMGQNIYDNVLSETVTDDGSGNLVKVKYTYGSNSHSSLDGINVVYDTVTKTEVGSDTGSTNGYVKMFFDNGAFDFTKAGVLLNTETYNSNNVKIADEVYINTKFVNYLSNSEYNIESTNYTWRVKSKTENSYVGGTMSSTVNYTYDVYGNLTYTEKLNSAGVNESTTLVYADSSFPFVDAKNLRGFLHKKVNKIGTEIVSVEKINWIQNGNFVYISNNASGSNENNVRVNSTIELVDSFGNILQTSNGLGINKSVLMGYNYKYVVASISNVSHSDIISTLNTLGINYNTLQTYNTQQLKVELLKLYQYFSKVNIDLFDSYGRKTISIDTRQNETNYVYDEFGRLKYTTDKNGKILKIMNYRYKNQIN